MEASAVGMDGLAVSAVSVKSRPNASSEHTPAVRTRARVFMVRFLFLTGHCTP
jgi:hypothetical protein